MKMFQIQACDNNGACSNNWLAYDGAEFSEEKADLEVAKCQAACPRYSYKKIPSGSVGGSKAQIYFATLNHNRPMQEVLKDGDDEEIQSRFNMNNRNADTGILYQTSHRWACDLLHRNGAVCTVGSANMTKAQCEKTAQEEAKQYKARCFVFSRKQSGCKFVSEHWWDDVTKCVYSRAVKIDKKYYKGVVDKTKTPVV